MFLKAARHLIADRQTLIFVLMILK